MDHTSSTNYQQFNITGLCRAIFEALPSPLAVVEGDCYVIRYVNPAFCKLIGESSEDLIGKAYIGAVPAEGECLPSLDRVYRTGKPENYIKTDTTSLQSLYWSYVMWPLLAADGRPLGAIIIQIIETTTSHLQTVAMNEALLVGSIRQHEFTEAAEELNTQLHAEMAARKSAEDALIQVEKLATVGRMAASLAHEINNPLEALVNLIYLARVQPDVPELSLRYLTEADEELMRITYLAKRTLGLYKENTSPAPALISDLLKDLMSIFATKITNKRIDVKLEVVSEIEILAVSGELLQVFANLLGNSIDAVSLDGTIRIRITDTQNVRRGLRITIADNGLGIPPENIGKVFHPFFTTKDTTGTGLGLWVSKQIIDRYVGFIRIRSTVRPGRTGTVASVFLPAYGLNRRKEGR